MKALESRQYPEKPLTCPLNPKLCRTLMQILILRTPQEARRFYEYTAAHPSDALDDDLCTFEEWWILDSHFFGDFQIVLGIRP